MTSKIRAVFFDVGGTLAKPYPSVGTVMSRVLERHDLDVPAATLDDAMEAFSGYYAKVYDDDESLWSEDDRQRQMWMDGYSLVLERAGVTENLEELVTAIYYEFDNPECWRFFDGVVETFAWLKERGYGIALISNWGKGLEELMNGMGLGEYIDTVVASADVGTHKPKPAMFYIALERLGVAPEESIHIGDHATADVRGAAAVGITPILVQHGGIPPWDPTVGVADDGVHTITAIPQVIELLESGQLG